MARFAIARFYSLLIFIRLDDLLVACFSSFSMYLLSYVRKGDLLYLM